MSLSFGVHGILNICKIKHSNDSSKYTENHFAYKITIHFAIRLTILFCLDIDLFSPEKLLQVSQKIQEDLNNGTIFYEHVDFDFTHPALRYSIIFETKIINN